MSTAVTNKNIKFPSFDNLDAKIAKNPITRDVKEPVFSHNFKAGEGINAFSCEGGGVKGIQQAVVLALIEELTGTPISKLYDIGAGTSVGGLMAVILTIPKEKGSLEPRFAASEVVDLFQEMVQKVFPQGTFKQTMYNIKTFNGLLGNKYSSEALKKLLEEHCGDLTLADTIIPLFIPVYNRNDHDIEVLSTIKARENPDHNYRLVDVLLGTTAAPGFLPWAKVTNLSGSKDSIWWDGGLGKNSPTLSVFLELLIAGYNVNNMTYISSDDPYVKGHTSGMYGGGKLDILINNVKSLLMDSQQRWEENMIERILPDKYYKIAVPLREKSSTKLDDSSPKNMQSLKDDVGIHLEAEGNLWLKGIVDNLVTCYNNKHPENLIKVNLPLYHELFSTTPPSIIQEIDEGYGEEDVSSSQEQLTYDLPPVGVNSPSTAGVIPLTPQPSALSAHPFSEVQAASKPIEPKLSQGEQKEGIMRAQDILAAPSLAAKKPFALEEDDGYDSGGEDENSKLELIEELLGQSVSKREENASLEGEDPIPDDYLS
ncbi:patatin-like phospholipase family protein [Candidatus Tisiphia endosymbiont of Beris chalybata]|uniref:patatin-like phospholipase family protein n=1 Tax=Candidatus Tisiphia endosymbiont of Beris chalybata TaxID=3066262 RepID=UPI00312CA733